MLTSGGVAYLVAERCALYDDYVYYKRNEGVDIFKDLEMTFSEYYSNIPNDFDPLEAAERMELSTDVTKLFNTNVPDGDRVLLKATYLGETHGFEDRTVFNFQIDNIYFHEYIFSPKPGDTIKIHEKANRLHYYTEKEFLLNYYGVAFEKGEEYLLFLDSNSRGRDISFVKNALAVCKLSGEYPSIKMFPGPVEYDATYFGAETKYVSADEFIELFMAAAT